MIGGGYGGVWHCEAAVAATGTDSCATILIRRRRMLWCTNIPIYNSNSI